MKSIAILGAGFAGTMTAVHLMTAAKGPLRIYLIGDQPTFARGVAYSPYSKIHLLNVPAARMSAFEQQPDHFLDWVMQHEHYAMKDRTLVAGAFLPRYLYGEYLLEIWDKALKSKPPHVELNCLYNTVREISPSGQAWEVVLDKNERLTVDHVVIACGNHLPGNPKVENSAFFSSPNYFRDPWSLSAVTNVSDKLPVLIVGNGLTMVDTVTALLERHYAGPIFSISPNGFNILPHRHNGLKYTALTDELKPEHRLADIVSLFNRHLKKVREFGLSAEPIIDSLRPHTQRIWRAMSTSEKSFFMSRLRHLWGVARHRIPLHIHDRLQQLRIDGRLHIYAGKLINLQDTATGVEVSFYNRRSRKIEKLTVSRVINCTGPETDLSRMQESFLYSAHQQKLISQDALKLGIQADPDSFQVEKADGSHYDNLFTLASHLKGALWESTAVGELRGQAQRLAQAIAAKLF